MLVVVIFDKEFEGGDIVFFDCGVVINVFVNVVWLKGFGCVVYS